MVGVVLGLRPWFRGNDGEAGMLNKGWEIVGGICVILLASRTRLLWVVVPAPECVNFVASQIIWVQVPELIVLLVDLGQVSCEVVGVVLHLGAGGLFTQGRSSGEGQLNLSWAINLLHDPPLGAEFK